MGKYMEGREVCEVSNLMLFGYRGKPPLQILVQSRQSSTLKVLMCTRMCWGSKLRSFPEAVF